MFNIETKKHRNYSREYANEKSSIKRYTIKIPLYLAEALDSKLKKEGRTYTSVAVEAIEKFLKKN